MIYDRGARALFHIALIAILTVLGIAAITELVTGSFLTWIESIFATGQSRVLLSYESFAHPPFVLVELLWIGIIPVSILVAYAHFNKLAHIENMTEKVLLMGAAVIFILIFSFVQYIYLPGSFYEAFIGPHYFIELFIPISIVLLWPSIKEIKPHAAKIAFMTLLFVPIIGSSARVARDAIVTAIDLVRSDTVTFAEIRNKIGSMMGGEPIAVDGLFIPAVEGNAKSLLVGTFTTRRFLEGSMSDMWGQERAKLEACVIVLKQSNTGLEAPPNISGFTLMETTFASPIRLFGLTFYRTPKGYNYAVYHRLTCR